MKTTQVYTKAIGAAMIAATTLFGSSASFAQIKAGDNPTTINPGSVLELESTNKGLLMPRISLTNTTTWGLAGTAVAGMHVYNTNLSITSTNPAYPTIAAKKGEYYWDGTGWVAISRPEKSTGITTFTQTSPATIDMPTSAMPTGGTYCPLQTLGSAPPACATDLNRNGSFTIFNTVNDVILDMSGLYSVGFTAAPVGQIQFWVLMYVDKTTPGVYELVDSFFIDTGNASCSAGSMNFKSVLKNLPARSYDVKVYEMHWYNAGAPAKIGIGGLALGACGQADFAQQRLIVSVSQ
ncbi:hypothetical protein [Dyadobacter diqingensis]|uniref:hypothetical protein n=1 Tax=Dyadobacter diqingensis TaxID=2938121 RepID=UPI0020C1A06A|nr:hypothetical protein [Dyadobacter diqingensis]